MTSRGDGYKRRIRFELNLSGKILLTNHGEKERLRLMLLLPNQITAVQTRKEQRATVVM